MNVDRIIVANRYRSDLGDLSDLAASIATHGLLHPVVITDNGMLIAGERRLEACKLLGWTDIPVRFIADVSDAAVLLRMERDENVCRKDMTPSEAVALGRALEELERPKAAEALAEGQSVGGRARHGQVSVRANGEQKKRFDTREVVAPAVGMSTATYSRAKQLVTAAEAGDVVAAEQVEEMDRTGKVTPAYEAWKGKPVSQRTAPADPARRSSEVRATQIRELAEHGATSRQIAAEIGIGVPRIKQIAAEQGFTIRADVVVGKRRGLDYDRILENVCESLEVAAIALRDINPQQLNPEAAPERVDSLTSSIKAIRTAVTKIKESLHE